MKKIKDDNIIDLEISQLHYSIKAIEYIKVTRKSDINKVLLKLDRRNSPKVYKLSVYYYGIIDGIETYHVYGQENGSENAFILGAILDNEFIKGKISIKGVLHPEKSNQAKVSLELLNLNKLYDKGYMFRLHPKTGIEPIFPLDKTIAKSDKRKSISNTDNSDLDEYIKSLKKRYEKYGYHDAKCPKGSPFCVHFCNDYDEVTNGCTFKCPFNLDNCDQTCRYYTNSRLLSCLYTKIK